MISEFLIKTLKNCCCFKSKKFIYKPKDNLSYLLTYYPVLQKIGADIFHSLCSQHSAFCFCFYFTCHLKFLCESLCVFDHITSGKLIMAVEDRLETLEENMQTIMQGLANAGLFHHNP